MIAPGADVMVILAPPNSIGLKVLELVNAKVVRPAKVTTESVFNFERSMVLFVGAAMPCKVMAVQDATAGAICEKTVAVHSVPEADAVLELELAEIVEDTVELELDEVVNVGATLMDELVAAVNRQEQAVETLDTSSEHWVAYAGSAVVALTIAVVNVVQKVAASAKDLMNALKHSS
jgi:hypothetical protein